MLKIERVILFIVQQDRYSKATKNIDSYFSVTCDSILK